VQRLTTHGYRNEARGVPASFPGRHEWVDGILAMENQWVYFLFIQAVTVTYFDLK
jgi:hypothetical protein